MNIEEVDINSLSLDPSNVRKHSDQQIGKLQGALKRWGQTLPLLVDFNGVVRIGNARLQAAQRLGWERIKIIRLDLSPSEWTALAIADNKLHDDSEFDEQALANVLASLRAEGDDIAQAAGFSLDEIAKLCGSEPEAEPATPPSDFPSVDENISVEHQCPKCHYVWSGSTALQGASK